eukprot:scaffold259730_cov18-Tisochrysis_lutea.AAC.1
MDGVLLWHRTNHQGCPAFLCAHAYLVLMPFYLVLMRAQECNESLRMPRLLTLLRRFSLPVMHFDPHGSFCKLVSSVGTLELHPITTPLGASSLRRLLEVKAPPCIL